MSGAFLRWACAMICCVIALDAGLSRELKPQRSAGLRSCVAPMPELPPLFVTAPPSSEKEDEEEEEEEEEEEDEEEEFDEEAVRGWLTPDGTTCMALGGSLTASVNTDFRALSKGRTTSLRTQDGVTFPLTGTVKFDTISTVGGWDVAAGLTLAQRSGTDLTLDRAMVSIGPVKAGRDVSTFVFFDGADFSFSARIPARQVMMFAYTMQLTDTVSLTAAIENPPDGATALAAGSHFAAGARWPDLIGRLLYEGDALTMHASGALRELRRADGGPTRVASAFLFGASKDFEVAGITHTLLAQGGGTWGGPVFIGSQLDGNDVLGLLTGGEISNGWSGITSLTSAWSDAVSTSAYASRYALRIPDRSSVTGRINISRYAMNVVWRPALMVKLGLEVGWSRSDITVPRIAAHATSAQRATATVWLQKNF